MTGSITTWILSLHGWVALAIVFLVPTLEASAFLGFVFPGEIAVILGGVLASQGRISLGSAIAAAVLGAIIGDSIGYAIGRRWGRRMLHGTLGRLPLIGRRVHKHLDAAEAYVRRRKGSAVFFGRFTAALRVLVPGLAGMSDVHYPTFLLYNVAGGVLWGAGFVLLGYLAGANYHRVLGIASRAGFLLLALVVIGLLLSRYLRVLRERDPGLTRTLGRIAGIPPLPWMRRRFPSQTAWLVARLDPSTARGFPLTLTIAVAALGIWAFAVLTQDVVGRDGLAVADPRVTAWMVAHRTPSLTSAMKALTWLGSTVVIVPLGVVLGCWCLLKRRDARRLTFLGGALAAVIATYRVVSPIVDRVRPPSSIWIGRYPGASFPSGHAAQAAAFYAAAAILLSTDRAMRGRVLVWAAAICITLVVGLSRLYLGANWLTDVLAAYALGAAWTAMAWALMTISSTRRGGLRRGAGALDRVPVP